MLLKCILGLTEEILVGEVYPTRLFDNDDIDALLSTETAKVLLKEVDKSEYLGNNAVRNALLGVQPAEYISGGVKVLLMAMRYRDLMFPMSFLGDN